MGQIKRGQLILLLVTSERIEIKLNDFLAGINYKELHRATSDMMPILS